MNQWLPVSPCATHVCVGAPRSAAGVVRRIVRLAAAAAVLLGGVPVALLSSTALSNAARRTRISMSWARLLLRALGVRIEVRHGFAVLGGSAEAHTRPEGGALMVANHVSWLDPLVVAATVPCRVLAKREVGTWPIIRRLAAGSGAIFIDRERLSALPGTVREIAAALGDGESVMAFPEGTTWCGKAMGPFRPAVFQAAVEARAPVRPVVLRFVERDGAMCTAPAYVGDDTLLASLWRVVAVRNLVAEITLFPALSVPTASRRSLAKLAEACVAPAAGAPAGEHRAGHRRTTPAPLHEVRAS
jgi:1-acyl-sn-glycerol-3-phosphate acyltransferase